MIDFELSFQQKNVECLLFLNIVQIFKKMIQKIITYIATGAFMPGCGS